MANQAIAYSINAEYCLAEKDEKNWYIIAVELLNKTIEKIGPLNIIATFKGLLKKKYLFCFKNKINFYSNE